MTDTIPLTTTASLNYPVTVEQWRQIRVNDEIAMHLVRSAQVVDLEAIAQRVRETS